MNRIRFSFLALLFLSASGCVRLLPCRSSREPQPLPEQCAKEAAYERVREFSLTRRPLVSGARYAAEEVSFPVPLAGNGTSKTLTLESYLPRGTGPCAVVLVLPVSAGGYSLERYLAGHLAQNGLAALILHRDRGLQPVCGEEINVLLRQSVVDCRHVLDWIETQAQFDPRRIGVLGTSMGAIRGSLLVAVDERVRAATLALCGSNLPDILTHSTDGAWRGGGISRRREAYLKEHDMTLAEFQRGLAETIVWDPARLASSVDPRRVRLILGACDTVVPLRTGLELRRAMGEPETDILLSGHYSAILYLPWISREAVKFFRKRFNLSFGVFHSPHPLWRGDFFGNTNYEQDTNVRKEEYLLLFSSRFRSLQCVLHYSYDSSPRA